MLLQIREEEKVIPRFYLAEILNISRSLLYGKVKKGEIKEPKNSMGYTRTEVEHIINKINKNFAQKVITEYGHKLADYKKCGFIFKSGGIFLISPKATKNYESELSKLIEDYGIWNAQGLNNHIHLNDFDTNPISQLFIAQDLIDSWVDKFRSLDCKENIVIYWNGLKNSTLCVYSKNNVDDNFLSDYDNYLKIKNCLITRISI